MTSHLGKEFSQNGELNLFKTAYDVQILHTSGMLKRNFKEVSETNQKQKKTLFTLA